MNWPQVSLSPTLAKVVRGVTFSQADASSEPFDGGVAVLRAGNIQQRLITDRDIVWVDSKFVSQDQYLQRNDILVCTSSGSASLVGKSAILNEAFEGTWGAFNAVIRSNPEILLPEYLAYWLSSDAFRAWKDRQVQGANIQNIRQSALESIRFPLPTLPEQQRIVDVLLQASAVDALSIQARQLLNSLAKQRFVEMFGHPAENPKAFETAVFESFGTLDRGVSKHRPRDADHLFGGPYPFIQTGDVSNAGDWLSSYKTTYSEAGLAQSRLWPKGTLCITIAANIAKAAILEFNACFPDSVVGFTPNDGVSSEYVLYCLCFYQEFFEHRAPKSAQMNINLDKLRTLRMPKPAETLQREFSRFVLAMRTLTQVATEQADCRGILAKELKVVAFTGELTAHWRQLNREQVKLAALQRDAHLRERGAKIINASAQAVATATAQADATVRPARHWLLGELSEFQRQVLNAFTGYCQQSGQPLLVEDFEVFARFCDDEAVTERLQAFGESLGNRIRRTLSQLASLGLIAKITLPKHNPDTGEREYLKAFRPLRPEEFVRMNDLAKLRKVLEEPEGSA